jgi:hypothetical protein
MGIKRGAIILSIVVPVLGLVLAACAPPQPAIVRELVALAPAGSELSVEHLDDDPWGGFDAHWRWEFETGDPAAAAAAIDTYRAWFAEQGIRLWVRPPDDEWPFPETYLAAADYGLSVHVPIVESEEVTFENGEMIVGTDAPGTSVLGILYDEYIGPDGQLTR